MRNAPAPMSPRTAAPPINPPTIAPVSLDFLLPLPLPLPFEDPVGVGSAVVDFVGELVGVVEVEVVEDFAADFDELLLELDALAAELSRSARWTVWKTRETVWPENVVKAVCHVDSCMELQKYC